MRILCEAYKLQINLLDMFLRDAGIKTFLGDSNKLDNKTEALWRTFNMDSYPFQDKEKRKTDPHVLGNIP